MSLATITALTTCELYSLSRDDIYRTFKLMPEVLGHMKECALERFIDAYRVDAEYDADGTNEALQEVLQNQTAIAIVGDDPSMKEVDLNALTKNLGLDVDIKASGAGVPAAITSPGFENAMDKEERGLLARKLRDTATFKPHERSVSEQVDLKQREQLVDLETKILAEKSIQTKLERSERHSSHSLIKREKSGGENITGSPLGSSGKRKLSPQNSLDSVPFSASSPITSPTGTVRIVDLELVSKINEMQHKMDKLLHLFEEMQQGGGGKRKPVCYDKRLSRKNTSCTPGLSWLKDSTKSIPTTKVYDGPLLLQQ